MSQAGGDRLFLGHSELARLMAELDWGATPIGPSQHWPHSLRTAVRIMLTSQQPIWIGWGKELCYLYNDPYKSIIGGEEPLAAGGPAAGGGGGNLGGNSSFFHQAHDAEGEN